MSEHKVRLYGSSYVYDDLTNSYAWEHCLRVPNSPYDDYWGIVSYNHLYGQTADKVQNIYLWVNGVRLYNLTPHAVNVPTSVGVVVLEPHSKDVVRIGEVNTENEDNIFDDVTFGEPINLPKVVEENSFYIVSLFTLMQMKAKNMDISQFVTTGEIKERDEFGKPISWGKLRRLV